MVLKYLVLGHEEPFSYRFAQYKYFLASSRNYLTKIKSNYNYTKRMFKLK